MHSVRRWVSIKHLSCPHLLHLHLSIVLSPGLIRHLREGEKKVLKRRISACVYSWLSAVLLVAGLGGLFFGIIDKPIPGEHLENNQGRCATESVDRSAVQLARSPSRKLLYDGLMLRRSAQSHGLARRRQFIVFPFLNVRL